MLEFRAPLQRHCTRPQPKAEMDQNAKQKERRHIEQKPILAGRCPSGQLSCHDQGANGLLLTVGRHGEQGLQHGIGGGEKVVQHSAMRQQGSDRFGVAGWEPERRELVQPFLHGKAVVGDVLRVRCSMAAASVLAAATRGPLRSDVASRALNSPK